MYVYMYMYKYKYPQSDIVHMYMYMYVCTLYTCYINLNSMSSIQYTCTCNFAGVHTGF